MRSNSKSISLDISNNSIKILQLSKSKNDYVVEQCIVANLNQYAGDKGSQEISVMQALQNLIRQNNLPKNVMSAISFSLVMSKEINLNCYLEERKLEEFLKLNMEKYAGFNPEFLNFDYQILQQDETSMRIFLVAVKREQVEQRIKMLSSIGLQAKIIDVDVYALARAVRFLLGQADNNVAVLNINSASLITCILQDDVVVHAQSDAMDTNLNDCKQLTVLIVNNLQLCISMLNQPLQLIVLCGEGVNFKLLMQHVVEKVDIPVMLANPFRDLKFAGYLDQDVFMNIAPAMMINFGLALRGFSHDQY